MTSVQHQDQIHLLDDRLQTQIVRSNDELFKEGAIRQHLLSGSRQTLVVDRMLPTLQSSRDYQVPPPVIIQTRDHQQPITVYPRDYQRYINSRNILPPLSPVAPSRGAFIPVVDSEQYQWDTQRPIRTGVERHVMDREMLHGQAAVSLVSSQPMPSRDPHVITPRDSLHYNRLQRHGESFYCEQQQQQQQHVGTMEM